MNGAAHPRPMVTLNTRVSLGIMEAAGALGVSRPTIYRLVARGELQTFKLGSRTLILVSELNTFVNKLADRAA